MGDAVLTMEEPSTRYARTVIMARRGLSRAPETFATILAHRHTAAAPRALVSRHVEHTSKVPIVALEENRLSELKPGKFGVRRIGSAAAGALLVASARTTVFCTALDAMKGDV
jgi:hypothetical protein